VSPDRSRFLQEFLETGEVTGDPIVRVVALQLLFERLVLDCDRLVQVLPAPVRERLERSLQAALRRLALDHPSSLQTSAPVVGEAQEVECPGASGVLVRGFGVGHVGRMEPDHARLLRVDRQAVLAHPLGQDLHDPPGVVFSGHPDHEVVRIANQESFPFQAGANLLREPFVEHVVQDDVG